jgi:general secretion pathway protein D
MTARPARRCGLAASLGAGVAMLAATAWGAPIRVPPSAAAPRANRWYPAHRTPPSVPPPPAPGASEALTDADVNTCKKPAPGQRDVHVTLKPETDVDHLIVWISSITCKAFVWPGSLGAGRRKVTIVAPALVTPAQAFRIFLDALGSVGLTVEPSGRFFQVIEAVKAKSKPIPLYDWDGRPITYKRSGS